MYAIRSYYAFSFILAGCGGDEHSKTTAPEPARSVQAQVTTVQPVASQTTTIAPGTVVALESVKVASRLMGYIKDIRITSYNVCYTKLLRH